MIEIIIDKFKKNCFLILVFVISGVALAFMEFDLAEESYLSLFTTLATVIAALIGFIGIFVSYKLQNFSDKEKYCIGRADRLKDSLYLPKSKNLIIQYEPDRIKDALNKIRDLISEYSSEIESKNVDVAYRERDILTFREIKYNLKSILKNKNIEASFNTYKDPFLFAIYSIFFFVMFIAFNHINYSNNNYAMIFNYWRFVKMPFTGLLLGLFYIILKDLANMLKKFFT